MTRGLVIGKFYPPHHGHKYLVETALGRVDHLDILVCVRADQSISGQLRQQWLQEIHPAAHVLQIDDIGEDDNSKIWASYTVKVLGRAPDLVFTSEDYGEAYARFLGCRHVQVDRSRKHVPISGTMIRSAPLEYWDYLDPCVRAHYVKRICIVGAESTGTTTLASGLAKHYRTGCVPEYGREYCEKLSASGVDLWTHAWKSEEFLHIARAQQQIEDQMARVANRVLICDTDALATSIWHERYIGRRSYEVEAIAATHRHDLYLLTDHDIPFVQDGLRDGENIRTWMTARFEEVLAQWQLPWEKLSGARQSRLDNAVRMIDELLVRKV